MAANGDKVPRILPKHLQELIDLLPLNQRVHQTTIFAAYRRSNYARRIRKIVSEYGWEIERLRGKEGANDDYYIRRSDGPVRRQQIRREVPPKQREVIYRRDQWKCQICLMDVSTDQDRTRPQCDHKVPAERGGPPTDQNLQTLCIPCNLKKRQACKACTLPTCDNCEFAYPEKLAQLLILRLDHSQLEALNSVARSLSLTPAEAISQLIKKAKQQQQT